MTESIQGSIREARALLESQYGDRLMTVLPFGSQARGEAELGSDVDLLVVLRGDVEAGAEIGRMSGSLAELSLRHDTVVSCVFMSESTYLTAQTPFLLNVRREGVAA